MTELKALVDEWIRIDRNDITRLEILALYNDGNTLELEKRLRQRIEFGTAGLRGRMEAGWSRMNDVTIIQASQGLCSYVMQHVREAAGRGIVIGYDHRHNSEKWAKLTAAAFLSQKIKVYLLDGLVHTPLVPFGVKTFKAACGVMITASHNPKQDNGYKVYWENAVQIIAPHDAGIAQSILNNLEPITWDTSQISASEFCINTTIELQDLYYESIRRLSLQKIVLSPPLGIVNTSMHGVSDKFVRRAFETLGYPSYTPVLEQQFPDPEFPTIPFPNPEERGALNLALSSAEENDAQYVLAQDPDSDRFGAAEKSSSGGWTIFTGDQLGTIFAGYIIDTYKMTGRRLNKIAMVASTVSSKMIATMARIEGFKFAECLTGFKYIGNTALYLVQEGYDVPFGYEEAIGFMFGPDIRDKDGVAATVRFVEIAYALRGKGKTVGSYLNELYERYGHFRTSNGYFICHESASIEAIFRRLRNWKPDIFPSYPSVIVGLNITRVIDLTLGHDTANPPSYEPTLPLSDGQMIQFRAQSNDGGINVTLTIRTSGTEPKIKYYLEGSSPTSNTITDFLPKIVAELESNWMEAKKHNLGIP